MLSEAQAGPVPFVIPVPSPFLGVDGFVVDSGAEVGIVVAVGFGVVVEVEVEFEDEDARHSPWWSVAALTFSLPVGTWRSHSYLHLWQF